jgi:hypothetical protein
MPMTNRRLSFPWSPSSQRTIPFISPTLTELELFPLTSQIARIVGDLRRAAVYPVAADKYFGPLPSPLRGVNQRVINARIGFSEPHTALVASSWIHLARVIPR